MSGFDDALNIDISEPFIGSFPLYRWYRRPPFESENTIITPTSNQVGLPAEFKHINQRWKRNQLGFPQ